MYKLLKNLQGEISSVLRVADNACIPFAPDNTDYQKYLEWVAAGNTPEPADEQN